MNPKIRIQIERAIALKAIERIEIIHKRNGTFIRWTPHFSGEPFEGTITEFIIERTRLYRDSWINPIIDSLLEKK